MFLFCYANVYFRVCGKGKAMLAPKEEYYERRRWSFSEIDEPYPISGDSYQGFDEDGLPVELGNSNYGNPSPC